MKRIIYTGQRPHTIFSQGICSVYVI